MCWLFLTPFNMVIQVAFMIELFKKKKENSSRCVIFLIIQLLELILCALALFSYRLIEQRGDFQVQQVQKQTQS